MSSDLLSALFTGILVVVGIAQAGLFFWQLILIKRSMSDNKTVARAAQASADAALAALDRPWLMFEGFELNTRSWSNGNAPLKSQFRISNYGKAPAIIKSLKVVHFRGPHHHNGLSPHFPPDFLLSIPEPNDFFSFVDKHASLLLDQNGKRIEDTNFILPSMGNTPDLFLNGWKALEKNNGAIDPITTTESYLLGTVYYEIPGQSSEIISFCYKENMSDSFSLFKDYPPYNERRKI